MRKIEFESFELIEGIEEVVKLGRKVIYRLYLRQKLELAEQDVREGRLTSHAEVIRETSQWYKK